MQELDSKKFFSSEADSEFAMKMINPAYWIMHWDEPEGRKMAEKEIMQPD